MAQPKQGETSVSSRDISLKGWLGIWLRVALRVLPDQLGLIAAGVAFYALLAIFPAIAALMAVAGMFTDPVDVLAQLQSIVSFLPQEAATIVLDQAQTVAGASDDSLSLTLILGVGFAIYLLTRATTSLVHGLNIAHVARETRGNVQYWVHVIALTSLMLFGVILLVLLLVVLPVALAFLPLELGTERLISWVRWLLIGGLVISGLAFLYRWGPSRRPVDQRWLTPGVFVAALIWVAGSVGFAFYVASFATYNETFGSLGGVIILLTWLWLSAFVVFLGALLDAEVQAYLAHRTSRQPEQVIEDANAENTRQMPSNSQT